MLHMFSLDALRTKLRNSVLYLQMAVLAVAGVAPILNVGSTSAEQITSRKVAISSSKPSETNVNYDLTFSWAGSVATRSLIVQFCSTPLGSCVLPGTQTTDPDYTTAGREMNISSGTYVSSSGFPSTISTPVTSATGACTDVGSSTSTMLCFDGGTTTAGTGSNATYHLTGIKNPGLPNAINNKTVYVRVAVYDGAGFTGTKALEGTVAASINQQLTVNGRVQERLNFCVAAIADSGTTDAELPVNVAACGALTNSSVVDLGVIDNSTVAKSPVPNSPPGSLGNARYGIAMLNTNASNGTAITYYAEPDVTPGATNQLRSFRVPGATCNSAATTITDQCFRSAADGTSGGTVFAAGSEDFGLNVPCIIQLDGANPTINSVQTTTSNLVASGGYATDTDATPSADCEKTSPAATGTYAWNPSSTAEKIAESSVAGSKVVDNEIVKLNFAATAGSTTPTGSYTAISTYIATPTF